MVGTGCVSEFVRYHYLFNKEYYFSRNIENRHNRNIILVDLSRGMEYIWNKEFSATNRNLVRKLVKEGFSVCIEEGAGNLELFIDMYESTMKNANAAEFYYFPRSFYYNLFRKLGNNIFLARVEKDGHTYAAALFFKSGNILTYYLSARDLMNYKVPSSNLLLSEVIKYAASENCLMFNLGGGTINSDDDSLFKFKKNFSCNTYEFTIGKRIHNPDMYESIRDNYIRSKGMDLYEKRKHILQFYR